MVGRTDRAIEGQTEGRETDESTEGRRDGQTVDEGTDCGTDV